MKKNVELAVCIPTYNRSEIIQKFMDMSINLYTNAGYDIYVYDSSEDNKTELVVKKWMQDYSNLYYVSVDPAIHSNMKVYNIFREFGDAKKYDYLWVCSDSICWVKRVLDSVNVSMQKGYDIIIPNYRDVENIGDKEYQDVNEFFLDCAWHMTLYGATILKISTMLSDVDWERLIKKYAIPDCINHSHVAYYFEKLSVMKNWKAIHLSFPMNHLTALKKYSGWYTETFYVWCHCWPTMIEKLPRIYSDKNKKKVIKKSGVNSIILSYYNLLALRKEHVLNLNIYRRYRHDWHNLTNVPGGIILLLSIVPERFLVFFDIKGIKNSVNVFILKRRMQKYCGKFDIIYIYGAGKKAQRYTDYMNEMGIEFEAYLVSKQSENENVLNNHKVIPFSMDLINGRKSGILLALNEENTREVFENQLYKIKRKKFFSEYKI